MILRRAIEKDELLLLEWRNDPSVLAISCNALPVTPENHHQWFMKILSFQNENEVFIWIAEVDGIPVGRGQIERAYNMLSLKTDACMIGYSIGRDHRGKGYGKQLVAELVKLAKDVHGFATVICYIKRTNLCSAHLAITCGVNTIELF